MENSNTRGDSHSSRQRRFEQSRSEEPTQTRRRGRFGQSRTNDQMPSTDRNQFGDQLQSTQRQNFGQPRSRVQTSGRNRFGINKQKEKASSILRNRFRDRQNKQTFSHLQHRFVNSNKNNSSTQGGRRRFHSSTRKHTSQRQTNKRKSAFREMFGRLRGSSISERGRSRPIPRQPMTDKPSGLHHIAAPRPRFKDPHGNGTAPIKFRRMRRFGDPDDRTFIPRRIITWHNHSLVIPLLFGFLNTTLRLPEIDDPVTTPSPATTEKPGERDLLEKRLLWHNFDKPPEKCKLSRGQLNLLRVFRRAGIGIDPEWGKDC